MQPPDAVLRLGTWLVGAIAATVAAAALVDGFFRIRWLKKDKERSSQDIDAIAETVRSEREGRAAAVAEALASQAMGEIPTPERFREILRNLLIQIDPHAQASKPVEQLINSYHEQALTQARVQFWFSIVAATVGFVWILYTSANIQADQLLTVFKPIAGLIMDAVAFLFFNQAAETRERATDLYDRLRRDKRKEDSSVLVASIEDVQLRSAVKAQLALHMAGLEPKPIDLGAFLSTQRLSEQSRESAG